MDVGKIDHECQSENLEDDVAAVSCSTQCLGCGGWERGGGGKAWGKGLGEKGKGKGLSTKGGQKGDSRGVKGSRKGGFKGSGFRCGQHRHRANECQNHSANAVEEEVEDEAVPLGGVWMVGTVDEYEDEKTWVMVKDKWLAKSVNAKQNVEVRNWFEVLAFQTNKDRKMTRTSAIEFNVAEVWKSLASAARMVKSGNQVVLDKDGSFIENKSTGERMEVRVKDETCVRRRTDLRGVRGDHPGLQCGRARMATGSMRGCLHDAEERGSPHVCRQRDPHHELGQEAD